MIGGKHFNNHRHRLYIEVYLDNIYYNKHNEKQMTTRLAGNDIIYYYYYNIMYTAPKQLHRMTTDDKP